MKHYTVQYTPPGSTLPVITSQQASCALKAAEKAIGKHDAIAFLATHHPDARTTFKTAQGGHGTATPEPATRYAI